MHTFLNMNKENAELGMANHSHLIKYLETQAKAVAALSPKVSKKPSGKAVHDLRVATRRVRAAFWCFRQSSEHLHFKKLNRHLRKLGKALGDVRELDVAIKDANYYEIDSSQLLAKRKVVQRKLRKRVNQNQRKLLIGRLMKAKKNIAANVPILFNNANNNLLVRLNQTLNRRIHGRTRLHQLRIAVKKGRYAFEAMGKPIQPMKLLQDTLGEAHDMQQLQMFVGKNPKLKAIQSSLNKKGLRLTKPTLIFAENQLRDK